jgi:hypothetical protein
MPKRAATSAPSLICRRCFEPARLQTQLIAAAYEQLVPARCRAGPAAETTSQRRTPRSRTVPLSSSMYQGVSA